MRRIVATELVSIDGVVEAPGGGDSPNAGWTFKDIDFVPEAYTVKGEEQEAASALLLGRATFQEFAAAWPSMEQFAHYNALPKYVVSTTLSEADVENAGWDNCHLIRSLDDVKALREKSGEGDGPITIHGSPTLVQSLAAADLIDHYTFLEFPVILGEGKRLFAETGVRAKLKLTASESYSNGIRMAQYDVVR